MSTNNTVFNNSMNKLREMRREFQDFGNKHFALIREPNVVITDEVKKERVVMEKKLNNALLFMASALAVVRVSSGSEKSEQIVGEVNAVKDRLMKAIVDLDKLPHLTESKQFNDRFVAGIINLSSVHMRALNAMLDK